MQGTTLIVCLKLTKNGGLSKMHQTSEDFNFS